MAQTGRPGKRLALAGAVGILLGSYTWTFFEVLLQGRTFVGGDPQRHHFPLLSLVRPLWTLEGGLPLWNPFVAAGQPWAANPEQAAFHPLTALFLFLPPALAFRLQVLLPVAAAAAGGLFLGRALSLSRTASLLLAVTWALGGTLLSSAQYFPTLFAAAALPWVLGFAARIGSGGGRRELAGLALSEALLCASGEPTQLLLSAPLALVAAWHAYRNRAAAPEPLVASASGSRIAGAVLAGIVLGGLVAAPILLPGFLHSRKTVRAQGLPPAVTEHWSTSPWRLGELLVPSVLGGMRLEPDATASEARDAWRRKLYPGKDGPYLESIYPGLLTTLLAAFVWSRREKRTLAWAGVALLSALVALGTHAFAWDALRSLPLFSGTRYPEKFLVFVALAVCVSAACGLDELVEAPDRVRRRLAGAAAALAIAAVVAAAALTPAARRGFPGRVLAELAGYQAALAAAGAVFVLGAGRGRRAIPAAILLCVCADLATRGRPLLRTGPVEELEGLPPQTALLRGNAGRGYLFHAPSHRTELWKLLKLGDPPAMARLGIATAMDGDFGMTELAWSARATETILASITDDPALAGPVFRRRSIAAILRFRPGTPRARREADRVPLNELLELLAVRDSQPLAFCAEELRIVDGAGGWRRAVSSLGERAMGTACVDREDAAGLPPAVSPGRVAIRERRPGAMRLAVEAGGPSPAFVAVNQTWHPGWHAEIDGRRARVVRTDLSLSGLVVPPGRHEVVLAFRDPSISAGLAIGLAALAGCAALAVTGRRAAAGGTVSSAR